ncbi:MAG: hypothetical protein E7214_02325 [Clostridium sp.]|nr:hypothetical protein [Clostridium sp.]
MESYLGKLVTVKMDRPLGSKHPKHNFIYPLNYGYIPNTTSGDGEEIDVYIIGVFYTSTWNQKSIKKSAISIW